MTRWMLVLLLLLLPFTMAPRTSEGPLNDWESAILTEGSRGSNTGTFVAHVWPGENAQSTQAVFSIYVGATGWQLVDASEGCEEGRDTENVRVIACVVDLSDGKPLAILRAKVRTTTGTPPTFHLEALDLS